MIVYDSCIATYPREFLVKNKKTSALSIAVETMTIFQNKSILHRFFFAFLGTTLFETFALKSIFIKLAYAQGLDTDSVLMLRMLIALPIYLLSVF